ncbi:MAG: hypothetical protein IKC63_07055 [Clostridia bacterium]|nr:hypothetical protein [Clostridia bacterium]
MKKQTLLITLIIALAIMLAIVISILSYWHMPMLFGDFSDDGIEDSVAEFSLSRYEFYRLIEQEQLLICFQIFLEIEHYPFYRDDPSSDDYDEYLEKSQQYYYDEGMSLYQKYNLGENQSNKIYFREHVERREFTYSVRYYRHQGVTHLHEVYNIYWNEIPKLKQALANGDLRWVKIFLSAPSNTLVPIQTLPSTQPCNMTSHVPLKDALSNRYIPDAMIPAIKVDQNTALLPHKQKYATKGCI